VTASQGTARKIDKEYLDYLLTTGLKPDQIASDIGFSKDTIARNLERRGRYKEAKSFRVNKWKKTKERHGRVSEQIRSA
jgi:IS30 family transposase